METSIFILYSLDDKLAKSESHSHMQEILNFSPAAGNHLGVRSSHLESFTKQDSQALLLTGNITAQNLYLKALPRDSDTVSPALGF